MVEQFTKNTPNSSTDACPLQHNFAAQAQNFSSHTYQFGLRIHSQTQTIPLDFMPATMRTAALDTGRVSHRRSSKDATEQTRLLWRAILERMNLLEIHLLVVAVQHD